MDVIKASVEYINPGQVPVIAFDQPLYALAKQIQWNWRDLYGEQKFVVMFGGLHIEQAFLKTLGSWLEDSGWTAVLVDADVASSGTADSFIKVANIKRTRKAHQVTVSALHVLLQNAYAKYQQDVDDDDCALPFDDWCTQQVLQVPQFHFWYLTMQLELLLLVFLRSIRQANFSLFIDSIAKMLPWFFALNHHNYARWLSVHLLDMRALPHTAPDVACRFDDGFFIVNKSSKRFSAIAIDQAHEQNNAIVKGDGGAVGLTENASALRRWMVSGPEIARVVNEFDDEIKVASSNDVKTDHHEQNRSFQMTSFKDVKALVASMEDLGNPFIEESKELLVLDTKDIASPEALKTLREIETIGKEQSDTFVKECLVERTKSLYDPIKKNMLYLFSTPTPKKSKASQQVSSLKSNCALFARLYISCQSRDGDLDEFFKHENQGCPPSLSNLGKLRLPRKKSELVECLQADVTLQSSMPTGINTIIIDAAAIVNMIKPGVEKTFTGYAEKSFLPFIKAQLRHADRVDIVWDEYIENSLKATTRCHRGTGVRRRVTPTNQLPRNWSSFLREDSNKRELFMFLADCASSLEVGGQVVTTYGQDVRCTSPRGTTRLSPCTHEEADTRMLLHAADAVQQGDRKILLRTVDTDVLVLAVAVFHHLSSMRPEEQLEVWVAFGTGINLRYIPAHSIACNLGPERSKALPAFHAFTGCDTVSCFAGRGKKTAMEAWKACPEVTSAFLSLSCPLAQITDRNMELLQRFVILMYDRTSNKTKVNDARKALFSKKGKSLDLIPPTLAALYEHTKRTALQAGHCWGQCLVVRPQLPSPEEWGWVMTSDGWQPFWTTLPDVTKSCRELVRCGCNKGCQGRCSCFKVNLTCSELCTCSDKCTNKD
jgi:hypothetical protein